jgi:glucose-1-phosphate thymidylyltransferase
MLEIKKNQVQLIHPSAKNNNSVIIEPCYLGEGVELNNSVVGPHVSLGKGTKVNGTIISNSIVQNNTVINQSNISNSMLGSHVVYSGKAEDLSIGDYSTHE